MWFHIPSVPSRTVAALTLLSAAACSLARMGSPYASEVRAADPLALALDQTMSGYASEGFTGTVLVAKGSRVLLYKGYGYANRAREIPNTAETRYPLGALANQFAATMVLRREAEGKLSTSDAASRFIPGAGDARLSDLLTRTNEVPGPTASGPIVPVRGLGAGVGATPAERFVQPVSSYVILQQILERVSGQRYADLLRTDLLLPNGLTRTVWDDGQSNDSLVARGYREPLGETVLADGLVAPLADLYRWNLALLGDSVLSAQAKARMFEPAGNSYGYGWVISSTETGARVIEHAADQPGFQTWFARFPDSQVLILLAVNNDTGWRQPIADSLTRMVVDGAVGSVAVVTP
jgi:CubicO group peptidase (beta-lactamase class C family)